MLISLYKEEQMGTVLNNTGFGACPDFDKYKDLVKEEKKKFDHKLEISEDKIVLVLSEPSGDLHYLPHICSCKFSHFINDERVYKTDSYYFLQELRELAGDEAICKWLNGRRAKLDPESRHSKQVDYTKEDIDECFSMGSYFYYEEGLSTTLKLTGGPMEVMFILE